jgi:cobalt-zinc-cadmium efflux system protein
MAHSHEHSDSHAHSVGFGNDHGPGTFDRAFAIGTVLNIGIVLAELVFGYLAHSLALIADAAHNLSDAAGLLLAWGAAWLSRRGPTAQRTYGYRRASILAALGNAALLLVATGGIAVEAIRRFADPRQLEATTVIWVAALAIVLNGIVALMFMRGRHDDLNIKGAFLHMIGDAAVSFGVVVAALLTVWTGWLWIDPAISLGIATLVLWAGWGLARSSVNLALDAVPENVDRASVEAYLSSLPGVTEVHDLHIWAMSTTETALTVHLVRPGAGVDDGFIAAACEHLDRDFKIQHATLQIEHRREACRLAPDHVV